MENDMKQFNLQEYLANPSRQVVTRDGRNVRIICTDRKNHYSQPIIALVGTDEDDESVRSFKIDGKWSIDGLESNFDLFFASEKHEGWINLNRCLDGKPQCGFIYDSEAEAKSNGRNALATIKIEWEE